jgi:hypothetical protein
MAKLNKVSIKFENEEMIVYIPKRKANKNYFLEKRVVKHVDKRICPI